MLSQWQQLILVAGIEGECYLFIYARESCCCKPLSPPALVHKSNQRVPDRRKQKRHTSATKHSVLHLLRCCVVQHGQHEGVVGMKNKNTDWKMKVPACSGASKVGESPPMVKSKMSPCEKYDRSHLLHVLSARTASHLKGRKEAGRQLQDEISFRIFLFVFFKQETGV